MRGKLKRRPTTNGPPTRYRWPPTLNRTEELATIVQLVPVREREAAQLHRLVSDDTP